MISRRILAFVAIAAGAVVLNNAEFPEGTLVGGLPAKVLRPLKPEERTMLEQSAENYVGYVRTYRESQ